MNVINNNHYKDTFLQQETWLQTMFGYSLIIIVIAPYVVFFAWYKKPQTNRQAYMNTIFVPWEDRKYTNTIPNYPVFSIHSLQTKVYSGQREVVWLIDGNAMGK